MSVTGPKRSERKREGGEERKRGREREGRERERGRERGRVGEGDRMNNEFFLTAQEPSRLT